MGDQLRDDDGRPLIVVVDDDPDDLAHLEAELGYRYAHDYVVVARPSPIEAITVLERLRTEGERAAVLASQWMDEMEGSQLLASARALHPRAKRALLIAPRDWGKAGTADAIRSAIAVVSTRTCRNPRTMATRRSTGYERVPL